MATPNETPIGPAVGRTLTFLAWPASLAALAFFFHLGMTGPRSDDWFFDFTSPVTGEPLRYVIPTWTTTHYRPLHHMFVPFLATAFASMPWLAVLAASLSHAATAAVLWHFLRSLAADRYAAVAAATLWMLYPVLFEVPLWVAAASTSVATSIALVAMLLALRFVRTGSLWMLPAIAIGSYGCCAFNEQPAALFAAMPLLALVATRTSAKRIAWRTPAAVAAAGIGVGAYLMLTLGWAPWIAEGQPINARGSASRLVTASAELENRWNITKDAANEIMWMPGMFRAAFANGMNTLVLGPRHAGWTWTIPWLLTIAAAAWMTGHAWIRPARERSHESAPLRPRAAQLLIGLVAFFAGFVPILVTRDLGMQPRYAYIPALGLAMCTAAVLDAATTIGSWLRRTRTLAVHALFFGAVPLVWAIATLGIQDGLLRRTVQDRREAAELRALIPDPPTDATFIIVRNDHRVTATGVPRFDGLFPGATNISWATSEWAREIYGRWDIWAAPAHWNLRGPVLDITGEGIRVDPAMIDARRIPPGVRDDPLHIPWSRAVTVAIDADGTVRIVDAFEVNGRIVTHPHLEHTDGVTIAIPVRSGP